MIIGGILFFSLALFFCQAAGCSLIIKAFLSTLAAWFAGLVLDSTILFESLQGFMCLRILLPILAMGTSILISNEKKGGS